MKTPEVSFNKTIADNKKRQNGIPVILCGCCRSGLIGGSERSKKKFLAEQQARMEACTRNCSRGHKARFPLGTDLLFDDNVF